MEDIKSLTDFLRFEHGRMASWDGRETVYSKTADALEQQAARIADLETKCRLYEASLDKSDERIAELAKDAERYRWLHERYTGFDFDWMADNDGKNGKQVICFEMGPGMRIGRDIDAAIDTAITASDAHEPAQPQQDTKE